MENNGEDSCCDVCGEPHATELCPELGLQDSEFENVIITRARLTLPHFAQAFDLENGDVTVCTTEALGKKTQFGPYEAKKTTHEFNDESLFVLKIMTKDGMNVSLDTTEEGECNWLCLIQAATNAEQQNLIAYQLGTSVFYSTTKDIEPNTELRVWYAPQYAKRLGKSPVPDGYSKVMLGMKVVYPSVEELAESQVIKNAVEEGTKQENQSSGETINDATNQFIEEVLEKMQDKQDENVIMNFKCRRCDKGFMTEIELGRHIRDHLYPLGSGKGGRTKTKKEVPKTKSRRATRGRPLKEEEIIDENADECEEEVKKKIKDEDYTPKPHQAVKLKLEPNASKGLRVLPRRMLKGKRTTGFLVDNEFLLAKSQIKTEKDDQNEYGDKPVAMETETASPGQKSKKRGRPSKNEKVNQPAEKKRQKLFEKNVQSDSSSAGMKSDSEPVIEMNHGKYEKESKGNENITEELNSEKVKEQETDKTVVEKQDSEEKESESINTNTGPTSETNSNENASTLNSVAPSNEISSKDQGEGQRSNEELMENVVEVIPALVMKNNGDASSVDGALNSGLTEHDVNTVSPVVYTTFPAVYLNPNGDASGGKEEIILVKPGQRETTQKPKDLETETKVDKSDQNVIEVEKMVQNVEESTVDEDEVDQSINNQEREDSIDVEGEENETEDQADLSDKQKESADEKTLSETAKNKTRTSNRKRKVWDEEKETRDGHKRQRKKKNLPIPMEVRDGPNGKEYICTICNKKYYSERYLRLHSPMHTNEFKCEKCDKAFARKESLIKHQCLIDAKVITLEDVDDFPFQCSNCSETFPTEEDAKKHLFVHKKSQKCEHCGQVFVKKLQFTQHICPKLEKSTFSCDICFQSFRNEQGLFQHVAMHTDIYKCEGCDKCYSRKDSLIRHITKCCPDKAEKYGVMICKKCSKTFGTQLGLDNHEVNCNMHRCDSCHQVFDEEKSLNEHECEPLPTEGNLNNKPIRFSCTECGNSFKNLHYLLQHKQSHVKLHECKICGKKMKSLEEKEDHGRFCLAVSKIQAEGHIKCDRCSEQFFVAKEYKDHYQVHTHSFHCEKCDKRFVKMGTLHNHQCIGAEGISCDYCQREFKNLRTYHLHMVTHTFVSRCAKCDKYFGEEEMETHDCIEPEESIAGKMKYVCHFCGKNFVSTSNLNKHMKSHGEKSIECPYCDKKFHYSEYLKIHIAGVHEKKYQYQCSDCGKVLNSKPGLISHTKLFHSDTKSIYNCPECGKSFNQKGNLKTHMYSHGKEKTFQCNFCSKSFKYPDQLNKHKLCHTVGMRYQCDVCEKAFIRDYDLKKHIQTNHSNKMYVCEFCHSRCGHKHTLQRHYRRKHPFRAHLVEGQGYIESLYQEVDPDVSKGHMMSFVEMVPQDAVEALSTLSSSKQTVITTDLAELISQSSSIVQDQEGTVIQDGTIIQGQDGTIIQNQDNAILQTQDGMFIQNQDGTFIQMKAQDASGIFDIPSNQEIKVTEDGNQIVILQIVNPQEQQIEVTELEAQVVNTEDIETIETTQEVGDYEYTENIITSSS